MAIFQKVAQGNAYRSRSVHRNVTTRMSSNNRKTDAFGYKTGGQKGYEST